MTLIMDVVLLLGGDLLMSLFTSTLPSGRSEASCCILWYPTFLTYIVIEIFSGAASRRRGCLDADADRSVGICSVRVLWIMFGLPHVPTIIGAAFCYPLSWILSSIAFIIYYCRFSRLSRRREIYLYR